jgi:hypothetical protein
MLFDGYLNMKFRDWYSGAESSMLPPLNRS